MVNWLTALWNPCSETGSGRTKCIISVTRGTHLGAPLYCQRDSLVDILREAANNMEPVENCHQYVINIPNDDPNGVWVTEAWNDASAHQASFMPR